MRETGTMWGGGGAKQGRFVILRFPLFCCVWGSQNTVEFLQLTFVIRKQFKSASVSVRN